MDERAHRPTDDDITYCALQTATDKRVTCQQTPAKSTVRIFQRDIYAISARAEGSYPCHEATAAASLGSPGYVATLVANTQTVGYSVIHE